MEFVLAGAMTLFGGRSCDLQRVSAVACVEPAMQVLNSYFDCKLLSNFEQ